MKPRPHGSLASAAYPITVLRLGVPLLRARPFGPIERLLGVRTALPLGPNDALLLRSFRCVHAFGAADAVEVVLLNRQRRIVEIKRVEPGEFCCHVRGVQMLVVAAGVAGRLALAPAHVLEIDEGTAPEEQASAD